MYFVYLIEQSYYRQFGGKKRSDFVFSYSMYNLRQAEPWFLTLESQITVVNSIGYCEDSVINHNT